ncbi:UNVERIFIED_CONTAM: hypothetical protein HDU68_009383 [Siphonaria sp. JEL0065]|nr:hypothetical protein HDU68_009383 [Siphonaria sp. JEL0065]
MFVVSGHPQLLHQFNVLLRNLKATDIESDNKLTQSRVKSRYLPVAVPFHSHYLKNVVARVKAEIGTFNLRFHSNDLKIPVYHIMTGDDLVSAGDRLTESLIEQICVLPVDWIAAAANIKTSHLLDFGSGGASGIGSLTARNSRGGDIKVVLASCLECSEGFLDKSSLFDHELLSGSSKDAVLATQNEALAILAAIWSRVFQLPLESITADSNFYSLGGTSLFGTRILAAINNNPRLGRITFSEFMVTPVLKDLAALCVSKASGSRTAITFPKVTVSNHQDSYSRPTSTSESRLFLYQLQNPLSVEYNYIFHFSIPGRQAAVVSGLQELINRHESLRTRYEWAPDAEVARVLGPSDIRIQLTGFEEAAVSQTKPFDLSSEPASRFFVTEAAAETWLVVVVLHHVCFDGNCISVLETELRALCSGENIRANLTQYGDYVTWERKVRVGVFANQELYWKSKLGGAVRLPFSFDYRHSGSEHVAKPAAFSFSLDESLTQELDLFSTNHRVSRFAVMTAAFNILLMRYSGCEDICIGSFAANRQMEEFQSTMGFFINNLCFRTKLKDCHTFQSALYATSSTINEGLENQNIPFEQVLSSVRPTRLPGRHPLFGFVILEQRDGFFESPAAQNKLGPFELFFEYSKTDFGSLKCNVLYDSALFLESSIEFLGKHLQTLLLACLRDPVADIRAVPFLFDGEKKLCVGQFNHDLKWSKNRESQLLHKIFEDSAAKWPDQVALSFGTEQVTYKELDDKSSSLAAVLVAEYGVQTGDLVALFYDRGLESVVATLAVLKSGAAFCPIDVDAPFERIVGMLNDTGVTVLLTESRTKTRLQTLRGVGVVVTDNLQERRVSDWREARINPSDLAYCLFTSGTTGKPKGVLIEHRNVFNVINAFSSKFSSMRRHLSFSSYTFDMSIFDRFVAFQLGATLVIASKEDLLGNLTKLIVAESIDSMCLTPSALSLVDPARISGICKSISLVGEPFSNASIKPFLETGVIMANLYGPTEAACVTTASKLTLSSISNDIGLPLPNCRHYVLDPQTREPVGFGCIGELYIGDLPDFVGGSQVGRGYLNRPDLTTATFLADPFVANARMYKTGDLARMHSNGHVEVLGRIDHQVKLRGYRIELGEIESVLLRHPSISSAVVVMREDQPGSQFLAAYLVKASTAEKSVSPLEMKSHCGTSLMPYMIPSAFVWMDKLPVTVNGKLDKRALPLPTVSVESDVFVPCQGAKEAFIASVWAQVLCVPIESIGQNSSFFALGGNSLLAARIISQLNSSSLIGTVSFSEFMASSSLESLAAKCAASSAKVLPSVEPVKNLLGYIRPASNGESRLFVYQHNNPTSVEYNGICEITVDNSTKEAISRSIQTLSARHEALRTTFLLSSDSLTAQVNEPTSSACIHVCETRREALQKQKVPFDLTKEAPCKFLLVPVTTSSWTIIAVLHHICYDGGCIPVFERDFRALCKGERLPPVVCQYGGFAQWEGRLQESGVFDIQAAYWKTKLSNAVPLSYSFDFHHAGSAHGCTPAEHVFSFSKDMAEQLDAFASRNRLTRFCVVTSVFNVLMMRYTGSEDISIGTFTANRQMEEFRETMGFFVNNVCLRTKLDSCTTFLDAMRATATTINEGLENQNLPFEQVLSTVRPMRLPGRHPLFTFVVVEQDASSFSLADTVEEINLHPFEFIFEFSGIGNGRICFDAALFRKETIKFMAEHLETLLRVALDNPQTDIRTCSFLTDQERHYCIKEFNIPAQFDEYSPTLLHEFFEGSVESQPSHTAIEHDGTQLSYLELNQRSNELADVLVKKHGVKAEDIVCLYFERGINMIVAILAVLKAGAAFCPIDVEAPIERIVDMLADTDSKIILVSENLANSPTLQSLHHCQVQTVNHNILNSSRTSLAYRLKAPRPANLAYVLFTSGTTGKPKAVMVEHRNISSTLNSLKEQYPKFRRHLAFASYTFDASVEDAFLCFAQGATLVLVSKDALLGDPAVIIQEQNIDSIIVTPSYLALIDAQQVQSCLKVIEIGGEGFTRNQVLPFIEAGIIVFNGYGPTEAAVETTSTHISKTSIPNSIGLPLKTAFHYILDPATLQPAPVGTIGELYIGGPQVGRGYLKRPNLTAACFIPNPFAESGRMYKTGDLGRLHSNGHIEILGRIDHQVKLRGYRIELGEIESVLQKHVAIISSAVVMREDQPGNQYLAAYVVKSSSLDVSSNELKNHCAASLIPYMIPTAFMFLDKLPVTINGKLDRRLLPPPIDALVLRGDVGLFEPVQGPTETIIAAIWAEFLQIPLHSIGRSSNFFGLGGNSLLAARIIAKMNSTPKLGNILFSEFMSSSTLKDLTGLCRSNLARGSLFPQVVIRQDCGEYIRPASISESRLFVYQQQNPDSVEYSSVFSYEIENTSEDSIQSGIRGLVARHEALRTKYFWSEESLLARVCGHTDVSISVFRNFGTIVPKKHAFDLTTDIPCRFHVTHIRGSCWKLVAVLHHICYDGACLTVFERDLRLLCGDKVLPLAVSQYGDFVAWERALENEVFGAQANYWRTKLKNATWLPYSFDFHHSESDHVSAPAQIPFSIDEKLTFDLDGLAAQLHVSRFTVILSVFNVLMLRYTGAEDICVGTFSANRQMEEFSETMGFFVNNLCLRTDLQSSTSFLDVVRETASTVNEALENHNLPFERVLSAVRPARRAGRHPLYGFVLLEQEWNGLGSSDDNSSSILGPFELLLQYTHTSKGITGTISYDSGLFLKETVMAWIMHLKVLLQAFTQDPSADVRLTHIISMKGFANGISKFADGSIKELPKEAYESIKSYCSEHQISLQLFLVTVALVLLDEASVNVIRWKLEAKGLQFEPMQSCPRLDRRVTFLEACQVLSELDPLFPLEDPHEFGLVVTVISLVDGVWYVTIVSRLHTFLIFNSIPTATGSAEHSASLWCSANENEIDLFFTNNIFNSVGSLLGSFVSAVALDSNKSLSDLCASATNSFNASYWKIKLQDASPLNYSFDFLHCGKTHKKVPAISSHVLDQDLTASLHAFCAANNVSFFSIITAIFNILMMRYTGMVDIVIGTISSSNNPVSLRTNLQSSTTFKDALEVTSKTISEAMEHSSLSFDRILSYVTPVTLPGRHPLFTFVLVDETLDISTVDITQFELVIQYSADGNLDIFYDSALFKKDTTTNLMNYVESLLILLVENSLADIHVSSFQFSGEYELCVNKFNIEQVWSENDTSHLLHRILEDSAAKNPDGIALVFGTAEITYADLDSRANKLAGYLVSVENVKPNEIVGLFYDRGIESIVATLAVLKAGGVFCPFDIESPLERIVEMVKDTRARIILTDSVGDQKLASLEVDVFMTDNVPEFGENSREELSFRSQEIKPSDLAYCLFTSGTTGKPKGVLIEHRNVYNVISAYTVDFPEMNRHLAFASYTFDMSIFDRFIAFKLAATLVVASKDDLLNDLAHFVVAKAVDSLCLTPSALTLLDAKSVVKTARIISLVGEPFTNAAVAPFISEGVTVVNIYGPTETACITTANKLTLSSISNDIGLPLPNCRHYVLDPQTREPVGFGCIGELYIGGSQVGRGYLNRPDLTTATFLADPFVANARMYKTGDLARMHSNGHVEVLGRIDHQVKLRGYRIELGEIESVLLRHPSISSAVVVMREDQPGSQFLAAYLVKASTAEKSVSPLEMKSHCGTSLMPYMIPSAFVWMDKLPVTVNGKLDKRALPLPTVSVESDVFVPCQGAKEAFIASVWAQVLCVPIESIGQNSSFFALGGNSLLAARIISQLNSSSLIGTVSFSEFMASSSLESLAAKCAASSAKVLPSVEPVKNLLGYIRPASNGESRLFVYQHNNPTSVEYNGICEITVDNSTKEAISRSIQTLSARHEALRTTFLLSSDSLTAQVNEPTSSACIHVCETRREALQKQKVPFDLTKEAPCKFLLVPVTTSSWTIIAVLHHICYDGGCIPVFERDFRALCKGERLPPVVCQYGGFAQWEGRLQESGVFDIQAAYWKTKLSNAVPLSYSFDFHHAGSAHGCTPAEHVFSFSKDMAEQLDAFASRNRLTRFCVVTSVFNVLMMRYTGSEDISIGTFTANRQMEEFRETMGFFVNNVCLRTKLDSCTTFLDAMRATATTINEGLENQNLPFEQVLSTVRPMRLPGRHPLFTFVVVEQDASSFSLADTVEEINLHPFEFIFEFSGIGNGRICFDAALFRKETIKFMAEHLETLLRVALDNPQTDIRTCSFLTDQERHYCIKEFNIPAQFDEYSPTLLHEFFEGSVESQPSHTAIEHDGTQLSYLELNQRSNELADVLVKKHGVKAEDIVCLYFERGINMIVAILAVLKAGAAFCPIDVEAPIERIVDMLADTDSKIILVSENLANSPTLQSLHHCQVQTVNHNILNSSRTSLAYRLKAPRPANLAYVLFTSGTTGKPKAVMVEHRNISSTLNSLKEQYPKFRRHLAFASYTFDASVEDAFLCFAQGATLVLVSKDALLGDPAVIIQEQNIDSIIVTPSYLALIDAQQVQSCLKVIEIGGEGFTRNQVLPFIEAGIIVFNGYGPTEAAVETTSTHISKTSIPNSIGLPLKTAFHYILDPATLQPAPVGTIGELYIGGPQVGRGYLKRPNLTAACFIPNPFAESGRMYKTGDLGRLHSNGHIEILGRIDHQVKLRGYRIELGEIESVLQKHVAIISSAVVMREDQPGNQYLAAYVVKSSSLDVSSNELKNHCAASLIPYMIPTAFMFLDKLPVTINGKLDRRLLPPPIDALVLRGDVGLFEPVQGPTETIIAAIWAEFLQIPLHSIGRSSNFFGLGGNSLLAARIIAKMNSTPKLGNILFSEFMSSSTLKDLTGLCRSNLARGSLFPQVVIRQDCGEYIRPASISESRLFVYQQQNPDSVEYSSVFSYEIENTSEDSIQSGIRGLVARHEALRTKYFWSEESLLARVCGHTDVSISVFRNFGTIVPKKHAFDLTTDIPCRFHVTHIRGSCWKLVAVLHHICYDGACLTVFERDLRLLCGDKVLPLAVSQYGDFVAWERALENEVFGAQANYWRTKLKNATWLPYSFDFHHSESDHVSAPAQIPFSIDEKLTFDLDGLAAQLHVSRFTVILSVFNVLMLRYTGAEDICVGTFSANRQMEEFSETMGFFVNNLCLRTDLQSSTSFLDVVRETASTVNEALENHNLPFERVLSAVRPARRAGRHPLYGFVLLEQEWNGLGSSDDNSSSILGPFELLLQYTHTSKGITGTISYDSGLFLKETVMAWIMHLKVLLQAFTQDPSADVRLTHIISTEGFAKSISKFCGSSSSFRSQTYLHEFFERSADIHPNAIAVEFGNAQMTYVELNNFSNRMARFLVSCYSVKPEEIVCLHFERGIDMIAATLAVLKTGAAFCPIDPEAPPDRISSMLDDTKSRIILTSRLVPKVNLPKNCQIVNLESSLISKEIASLSDGNIQSSLRPTNLAYVLFTSGTTGKPKGVLIEHQNVCHMLNAFMEKYPKTFRRLAFASYTFDLSILDQFSCFASGATLVLVSKDVLLTDPSSVIRLLNIDSIMVSPSYLALIDVEKVTGCLRTVKIGGERYVRSQILPFIKSGITVLNGYGPTEASVNTACSIVTEKTITNSIGLPFTNTFHYVLDSAADKPAAIGTIGELCVGGGQVGRGYLNRPDISARSFVSNPFALGVMYKTGDLARMHANGHVEILGRIDQQVKLRGFRIELGEIESAIIQHPAISAAAVIMREDQPGNQYLAAYVVKSFGLDASSNELKSHCAGSLIPYMIPTAFMFLDKLPVTNNGKLDKRALPVPIFETASFDDNKSLIVDPRSPTEVLVHSTWCRAFGLRKISILDDFFDSLGGHSLLAARIVNTLRSSQPEYNKLSIKDILTVGRTIEGLAKRLDSFSSSGTPETNLESVDNCGVMMPLNKGMSPSVFLCFQILGIMIHLGVIGACAFIAITTADTVTKTSLNERFSLIVSPLSAVAFGGSYLICTILIKWIFLQTVKPGDYPIRGTFHLRWWMVNISFQIAKTLLLPFLRESQLFNVYLRALGFRIGRGTIVDTVNLSGFECVEIGDFSFVGDDSTVLGHQYEVDRIRLVKTAIGSKCITGTRSIVNPGVIMDGGVILGPMSSAFGKLSGGNAYHGSPAVLRGPAEKVEMDPGFTTRLVTGIYQPICLFLVTFLAFTAQLPGSHLFAYLPEGTNPYVKIVFSATILGYLYSLMYALQVVVLKWLLVQQSKEGEFELGIWYRMRRYLFDRLVVNFLHHTITAAAFQGSILLPLYLRLLGAKVNWKVWLADIGIRTGVDLVTIQEGVVMGGDNLVYSHSVMGNRISFKSVVVETASNTGNSVVVLPGSRIGRNTLVGDLTLVEGQLSERSVWIGSPCVRIQQLDSSKLDSKKQQAVAMLQKYAHHTRTAKDSAATVALVDAETDASNSTPEPEDSTWRTILREIWILALKFTMFFPEMVTILFFTWTHILFLDWFGPTAGLWLIPINAIACIYFVILCIWFVKTVFVGKFIGSTSVFSFKFLVWTTYGSIYNVLGNVFLFIQGTALLPAFLRFMGSKVGRNVYMEGIPPIETDQLEIGDDAIIMDRVVLQPHVIDHATLQFARISIGDGVVMEPKSSLQALSTLSKGSKLKALSFVMKGETIPEDTVWAGNPSKFVGVRKKVVKRP